jgi:hypothetical protein
VSAAILAETIDEREAAAHRDLPRRLVDHHEVHELRHAGVGGAARPLVLRDDQIHEETDRRIFVRREELRLERLRAARGGGARLLRVVVRLLGFRRRPHHRGRHGRRREDLKRRTSSDGFH